MDATAAMHSQSAALDGQPEIANKRSTRDFNRARRHSLLVAVLKKILPIGAVAITVSFAASAILSYSPVSDVSIGGAALKDGKLVMNAPKMAGFNKENRPYDVKASKAIQDLDKPGLVELELIDARLPMDATTFADVDANSGTYDTNNEKLNLRDNVLIKGARGMDIQLMDADIDMKSGSLVSSNPVQVTSPDTDITADSVQVEDNGKRIIFKKRVKMTIKKPVSRGVKPQPNGASN